MNEPTQRDTNINTAVKMAEFGRDMVYVKDKLDTINDKISHGYVTKEEFDPIKRLVYGTVGLVLISFMVAILALVVKGGSK